MILAKTSSQTFDQDIDGRAPTFAAIWIAVVGVISYMFLPLIVGGLADDLGFSHRELGYVGAAEAGGMGVANALAVFWVRKWNWRSVIVVSATLMVVANLWSIEATSFSSMFLARSLDGLAGGSLIALGVACQSDNSRSDKVFGYFIATEMVFSSLGFFVLPSIQADFGVDGIFTALAIISISGGLAALVHPRKGLASRDPTNGNASALKLTAVSVLALSGALLFFMSQGGLWTFVERIAVASDIDAVTTGRVLAVSSLFGLVGALGASIVARKIGQLRAFLLVLVGELVCINLLHGHVEVWSYFASISLFILFWSMGLPLMLSQFNRLDKSGQLVILLYAMGKLGYTLGPAVMGLLIFGNSFFYVLVATATICTAGLGVSVWLAHSKNTGAESVGD